MHHAHAILLALVGCGGGDATPPPSTPTHESSAEATFDSEPARPRTEEISDRGAAEMLAEAARVEAPGASSIGSAQIRLEDAPAEIPFRVPPGACITAIAYAPGARVEASLVLPTMNTTLTKGGPPGPLVIVGGSSTTGCWKNPTPLGGQIALRLASPRPTLVFFQLLAR